MIVVRHEVANLIVNSVSGQKFNLSYCRQFPTLTCVIGNDWVRSSGDNVALSRKARRMNREGNSTLAASGRTGARENGMRNICELLINVVNDDVPKMLTGTDQKVRGMVRALAIRPAQSLIPPAERQTLTRFS